MRDRGAERLPNRRRAPPPGERARESDAGRVESVDQVDPQLASSATQALLSRSGNPARVVEYVVGEACRLIEDCISGDNADDFRREFLSYWMMAADAAAASFISLIEPCGPGRPARYDKVVHNHWHDLLAST